MFQLCQKISVNDFFQRVILFLIIVTAMAMGVEAVPALAEDYGDLLYTLDYLVQAVFVAEIVIRILACGPDFRRFFRDRWNTFDFLVVALSLVPAIGSFALIGRLLRALRILRTLSVSDYMRSFIGRLQSAFDEVAGASVIIAVVGYIFVIAGHYLFADIDPAHWGDLRHALLSVFYLMLFQDIPAFVEPLVARTLFALLFFAAFYAVFIGLALSTAVAAIAQEEGKAE